MAGNPSNRGVQLALGERMYMLHKPLISEGSALSWRLPPATCRRRYRCCRPPHQQERRGKRAQPRAELHPRIVRFLLLLLGGRCRAGGPAARAATRRPGR